MSTTKWIDRLFFLFLVIFVLLYVGAKTHFFHPILQAWSRRLSRRPLGFLGSYGDRQWYLGLPQFG